MQKVFSYAEIEFSPSATPHGPEQDLLPFLMRALDEVDYGLVLLRPDLTLWWANHLARAEMARADWLYLEGAQVRTRVGQLQAVLQTALTRASQGGRSLLDIATVSPDKPHTSLAVVPMAHPVERQGAPVPVLLIACRPTLCAQLSLRFYAQTHGLTRTEEAVLTDLVRGQEAEDIARERGMALSTVRSHIKQLRIKTRSGSMRELLNKVAVLPPVVSAVRTLG